jgi:hypothetical protein
MNEREDAGAAGSVGVNEIADARKGGKYANVRQHVCVLAAPAEAIVAPSSQTQQGVVSGGAALDAAAVRQCSLGNILRLQSRGRREGGRGRGGGATPQFKHML